jgi:hypothetical protein
VKPAPLVALAGVLEGRVVRVAGIAGASSKAAAPARRTLEQARQRGFEIALLFSAPGATPFEPLGYRPLPSMEAACRTRMPVPWPKEPAWVAGDDPFTAVEGLRPFGPQDREALEAIHETSARGRFRLRRDAPGWDRALAGLVPGGVEGGGGRHAWVIDAGSGVEAYLVLDPSPEGLRWSEHGARPGAERRLIDLFWAALSLGRRIGARRLEGWLMPKELADLYPISRRRRALDLPMIRVLDPALAWPDLRGEDDCPLGELDAF